MAAPWTLGAQVRIKGLLHGNQTINVLNFASNSTESDTGVPSPLLVALLTAVIECVMTTLLPAVTSDWEFTGVDGRYIYNSGGSPFGSDPIEMPPSSLPAVGELSACSVSFSASLMRVRSGLGGRNGRGRWFLPPPGEAEVTQSSMSTDSFDLLVAFAACMAGKFIGGSATEDFRLGVLSRQLAGTNNTAFNTGFFPAGTLNPVGRLAVIAKRKSGRGA